MNNPEKTAKVIYLPEPKGSSGKELDTPGRVIPMQLPERFHQGASEADPRSVRYDLSGNGLNRLQIIEVSALCDQYFGKNPTLDAAVDYVWIRAKHSLASGEELSDVLNEIKSFLDFVASDEQTGSPI